MPRDYYETLGVPRNATEKDIRAAYRRLARQYHPDVNPGDKTAEARFKEINEAYQVLSNADHRDKYDQFGANWRHAGAGAPGGPGGPNGDPFIWFGQGARRGGRRGPQDDAFADAGVGGIGDLFGGLFGSRRGGRATTQDVFRMEPQNVPVTVRLEEAYTGTRRVVEIPGDPFAGVEGRRLEVRIPAGVDTGSKVHIAAPAAGGSGAVDVNLVITVEPHPVLKRLGDDLEVQVEVPLATAMLGGEAQVPTLKGTRLALKLPPETQNGRTFRLKGQGMPRLKVSDQAPSGDLLATVKVVLPTDLTRDEQAFFEQMRHRRGG
ncbi:MAG: J domain-containing protein [SAR202 cluster bacterium]|nr:J domain-containing protein [SAR202 cluster bacterium]